MPKLANIKRERFAQEYVIDLNAKRAAIRAGYSAKTAESQGSRLLSDVKVQERVAELQSKVASRLEITQERVLLEYARIAFFDPRNLFGRDGKPTAVPDLDEDTARAIVGVDVVNFGNAEVGAGEILKVKLADKKGALDSLAKHLGMFAEKPKDAGEGIDELLKEIADNLPV